MSNVVSITVSARGFGKDAKQANKRAVKRLRKAADEIEAGHQVVDAGVDVHTIDPGGGGPCAAMFVKIPVNVSGAGLPEAESRDNG